MVRNVIVVVVIVSWLLLLLLCILIDVGMLFGMIQVHPLLAANGSQSNDVWECPDFYPAPNNNNNNNYVFKYSNMPIRGDIWMVGSYTKSTQSFVPSTSVSETRCCRCCGYCGRGCCCGCCGCCGCSCCGL